MQVFRSIPFFIFILVATILEVTGDALLRKALHDEWGTLRPVLFVIGAVLLFGYGVSINLAPIEFGKVAGLYIATLFIVWQIINFIAFRTLPAPPVLAGGAMIVAGGLIVTFWRD